MEAILIVAAIAQRFRFTLVPGQRVTAAHLPGCDSTKIAAMLRFLTRSREPFIAAVRSSGRITMLYSGR